MWVVRPQAGRVSRLRIGNKENYALFLAEIKEDFNDFQPGPEEDTVMIDSKPGGGGGARRGNRRGRLRRPHPPTSISTSASTSISTNSNTKVIRVCSTVEYIGRNSM